MQSTLSNLQQQNQSVIVNNNNNNENDEAPTSAKMPKLISASNAASTPNSYSGTPTNCGLEATTTPNSLIGKNQVNLFAALQQQNGNIKLEPG